MSIRNSEQSEIIALAQERIGRGHEPARYDCAAAHGHQINNYEHDEEYGQGKKKDHDRTRRDECIHHRFRMWNIRRSHRRGNGLCEQRSRDRRGDQREQNLHAESPVTLNRAMTDANHHSGFGVRPALGGLPLLNDRLRTSPSDWPTRTCPRTPRTLNKSIATNPSSNPKDMHGLNFGIELHIISTAMPDIARVAQEIVHLIGVPVHRAKLLDWHIDI